MPAALHYILPGPEFVPKNSRVAGQPWIPPCWRPAQNYEWLLMEIDCMVERWAHQAWPRSVSLTSLSDARGVAIGHRPGFSVRTRDVVPIGCCFDWWRKERTSTDGQPALARLAQDLCFVGARTVRRSTRIGISPRSHELVDLASCPKGMQIPSLRWPPVTNHPKSFHPWKDFKLTQPFHL